MLRLAPDSATFAGSSVNGLPSTTPDADRPSV
jgi:hypothetical protein